MSTNSFLITELFVLRAVDEELAPRKVRDGAKTEELKRLCAVMDALLKDPEADPEADEPRFDVLGPDGPDESRPAADGPGDGPWDDDGDDGTVPLFPDGLGSGGHFAGADGSADDGASGACEAPADGPADDSADDGGPPVSLIRDEFRREEEERPVDAAFSADIDRRDLSILLSYTFREASLSGPLLTEVLDALAPARSVRVSSAAEVDRGVSVEIVFPGVWKDA